jgi:hypothetical protein
MAFTPAVTGLAVGLYGLTVLGWTRAVKLVSNLLGRRSSWSAVAYSPSVSGGDSAETAWDPRGRGAGYPLCGLRELLPDYGSNARRGGRQGHRPKVSRELASPLHFAWEPAAWFILAGRFWGFLVSGIAGVRLGRRSG